MKEIEKSIKKMVLLKGKEGQENKEMENV